MQISWCSQNPEEGGASKANAITKQDNLTLKMSETVSSNVQPYMLKPEWNNDANRAKEYGCMEIEQA